MSDSIQKQALFSIQYGLYVITAKRGDKLNGQIANVLFQVTSDPLQVATCLHKENLTHDMVRDSGYFGASVLEQDTPMKFIGTFGYKSGRDIDKFEGVGFKGGINGVPLVTDYSAGVIEVKVVNTVDVGTHTLFIGEVVSAECLKECNAMTYEYYHAVKKGKSPEKAPTFGVGAPKKEERKSTMKKYVCDVCGYVYDPEKGDPDNGVQPGTAFENIPEDWVCPVCGVGKDQFSEE